MNCVFISENAAKWICYTVYEPLGGCLRSFSHGQYCCLLQYGLAAPSQSQESGSNESNTEEVDGGNLQSTPEEEEEVESKETDDDQEDEQWFDSQTVD